MPEIVQFRKSRRGARYPAVAEKVLRHLPLWKVEFTQIHEPKFPHLVDQLEFLADAVEDFAEGALPGTALRRRMPRHLCAHLRPQESRHHPRIRSEPGPRRRFQRGARRVDPERKSVRHLCRHAGGGLVEITSEP